MDYILHNHFVRNSLLIFTGIPLFLWLQNNLPFYSITLKESISLLTILMFCLMAGEIFWSRLNRHAVKNMKMSQVIRIHKIIGYTLVCILLVHPFFLVVPKFFESGLSPSSAFIHMLTTFHQGIVFGILAWILLAVLGLTALMRRQIPIQYKTWKLIHGFLAALLLAAAAWHAVDLTMNTDIYMGLFIVIISAAGILLYIKQTFINNLQNTGKKNEI